MTVPSSTPLSKIRSRLPEIKLRLVHQRFTPEGLYAIRTPQDAACLLSPLCEAAEEHFVSLHLNAKLEVLGVEQVSHGTLVASLVHPREVFKAALLANSYAILVSHNHPSGSKILPSSEDLAITSRLVKAGEILGVEVIDHLVLSPNQDVLSLRESSPELWTGRTADKRRTGTSPKSDTGAEPRPSPLPMCYFGS